jgi:hypothetical protein
MQLIRTTSEADMISVYLKAEIDSSRYGQFILGLLEQHGKSRSLVDTPDITNKDENAFRRYLLGAYRSYVFEELPSDTVWYRALLNREEVAQIRYIDYDYWNALSDNTRMPSAAVKTIAAGREVFGVSNEGFLRAAQMLKEGALFPELILVGTSPADHLTVYEGHLRLTAYLLAPECIPEELEVIVGFAPGCARI